MLPKRLINWLVILAFILIVVGFALDNRLQVTHYDIGDSRVPEAFDGFVIVQLSDIHCRVFGENQSGLIKKVATGKPDVIMLTGDIFRRFYTGLSKLGSII